MNCIYLGILDLVLLVPTIGFGVLAGENPLMFGAWGWAAGLLLADAVLHFRGSRYRIPSYYWDWAEDGGVLSAGAFAAINRILDSIERCEKPPKNPWDFDWSTLKDQRIDYAMLVERAERLGVL